MVKFILTREILDNIKEFSNDNKLFITENIDRESVIKDATEYCLRMGKIHCADPYGEVVKIENEFLTLDFDGGLLRGILKNPKCYGFYGILGLDMSNDGLQKKQTIIMVPYDKKKNPMPFTDSKQDSNQENEGVDFTRPVGLQQWPPVYKLTNRGQDGTIRSILYDSNNNFNSEKIKLENEIKSFLEYGLKL